MRTMTAMLLVLTVATGTALAQGKDAAGDRARRVAPFVEEGVILVMAFDFGRVDVDAVIELQRRVGRYVSPRQVAKARQELTKLTESFKTAGGRHLYLAINLNDVMHSGVFTYLISVGKGSDVDTLTGLVSELMGSRSRQWKTADVLVLGASKTVERLRNGERKIRPEVTAALPAGGETAFRLIIVPTSDSRRAFAEMMPELPPSVGGGPVDPIAKGLRWASLAVDMTPKLSVKLRIQCADQASARELLAILKKALDSAPKDEEIRKALPDIAEVIPLLTPGLDGTALTLTLDERQTDTVIEKLLRTPMRRAQAAAKRTASLNNLRQLLLASFQYANGHKDKWPDNFKTLRDEKYVTTDKVFQNPRLPGRKVGYVYVKPSKKDIEERPGETVVVYEAYDVWPAGGIWVGFLDGHAKLYRDEKSFRKLLDAPPR